MLLHSHNSYKFVNTHFKTIIFKTNISHHFPICFQLPTSRPREENKAAYITKRAINNDINNIKCLNNNCIK